MQWVRINDIVCNEPNGLSVPAIGDVDGDGSDRLADLPAASAAPESPR